MHPSVLKQNPLFNKKRVENKVKTESEVQQELPIDSALQEVLKPYRLLQDGNCLFTAVADEFWVAPHLHNEVRSKMCDFIVEHKEDFEGFIGEGSFEDYVVSMRTPGSWGGYLEMQALSILFQVNFLIYSTSGLLLEIDNDFADKIKFWYESGDHYDLALTAEEIEVKNLRNNPHVEPDAQTSNVDTSVSNLTESMLALDSELLEEPSDELPPVEPQEPHKHKRKSSRSPGKKKRKGKKSKHGSVKPARTDEAAECVICLCEPKKIAFIPCGHVCACAECSKNLENCPLCRVVIKETLVVYF